MATLPQKQVRRRNLDQPGWTSLPASGRKGRAPKWPTGMRQPDEVKALWKELWSSPQAVMWDGIERFVARYCLVLLAAEGEDMSAALLGEVRQMEDRLGLSAKAMEALRWQIVDDTPAAIESNDDDEVEDYL